jgi:Mg2+-importing ATPase
VVFRSRPGRFLVGMTTGAVAVAILLPILPPAWGIGGWFGFVQPPPLFFVFLLAATLAYLGLVEVAKVPFYRLLVKSSVAPG